MSISQLLADKVRSYGYNVQVRGDEVFLCCPFHGEKNPSFSVNVYRGGKCFACDKKFRTADDFLKALSNITGFDYEPLFSDGDISEMRLDDQDVLPLEPLDISALKYYVKDDERFEREWSVTRRTIEERRLVIDPLKNAECYPIVDRMGNFWGCVERTMGQDRSHYHYPPKIQKSSMLIGEDILSTEIWLVEGVRDLCYVESNLGVRAVALGTAIPSFEQIKLLRRYERVNICLDNDYYGVKGAKKVIRNLHPGNLSIIDYTGEDPAKMVGSYTVKPLVSI